MSNFRRDRPQPNRAKIRKCGYTSYACYVSFSTTITVKSAILPKCPEQKAKRRKQSRLRRSQRVHKAKARFLFPRFLCFFQAFCRGFHYDIILIVQPVKLCVKLSAARGFFAFFIWEKELVYRDIKKRH
jgi:hypothetical protein